MSLKPPERAAATVLVLVWIPLFFLGLACNTLGETLTAAARATGWIILPGWLITRIIWLLIR